MNTRSAALASFLFAALGAGTAGAKDPALSSLTMEHFRDTATVKENPGDGTTIISTENGFVEHTGLMRMVWHDEFLRAVIERQTGRKSFQVYAWVIYPGSLRTYETADYRTADGAHSVPVQALGKEVVNCAVGDCTYTERVAFPVAEELLRQLAAARSPGRPDNWTYRLVAKSGAEFAGALSREEIAGFLAKVDEYAARPPVTANGSAIREFGIDAMSVEATEEYPKRAGLLVIGVDRGSAGRKAGVIVGDILYEFGGHPLATPADLQAAWAGHAAGSEVAIKLYRGTNDTTLSARF